MKEKKKYAKYELKNGNVLKDGHTMFLGDVVKGLNRKSFLEGLYDLVKGRFMLLNEGEVIKKGDEYRSPMGYEWELVPKTWEGKTYTLNGRSTVANFNIVFRREIKSFKDKE